jgi:hypothetical protein
MSLKQRFVLEDLENEAMEATTRYFPQREDDSEDQKIQITEKDTEQSAKLG